MYFEKFVVIDKTTLNNVYVFVNVFNYFGCFKHKLDVKIYKKVKV